MVILSAGKKLGHGDLSILVRDGNGRMVDPFFITFDIFTVNERGEESLVTPPQLVPRRASHGSYWVDITVPTVWLGRFKLVWRLQETEAAPLNQVVEDFRVENVEPARSDFEAPSAL